MQVLGAIALSRFHTGYSNTLQVSLQLTFGFDVNSKGLNINPRKISLMSFKSDIWTSGIYWFGNKGDSFAFC